MLWDTSRPGHALLQPLTGMGCIVSYKGHGTNIGREIEWTQLTKEKAQQPVSNHTLTPREPGCSLGFSLSGMLYCSVQPLKKREEERVWRREWTGERGKEEGGRDWGWTLVTLVLTVIPISNDINYFRGGTLCIYIEMSTMAFLPLSGTQEFSSLYLGNS